MRLKRIACWLTVWLFAWMAHAAVPTFQSFEPTQFDTNALAIKYLAVLTNELGQIHPAQVNDGVTVTNFTHYGTLVLPDKVTLLTLGTNVLDMATNSAWLLYSPTNDASQVTIVLKAGSFQGQIGFIQSQNSDGAFTLHDLSEQDDVPGAFVDISGDWIATTNRGILLRYTAPDWVEASRADPSSTNGPFVAFWAMSGGSLVPSPAVTNVLLEGSSLGIGSLTNLFFRSGGHLSYSNGLTTGVDFRVIDGAGNTAAYAVDSGGNALMYAGAGKSVKLGPNSGGDLYFASPSAFYPNSTNHSLGTLGDITRWGDILLAGKQRVYGHLSGASLTNVSRMDVYHTGTNGFAVFDSIGEGAAGASRGFRWASNGVVIASLASNSGYTGTGTNFLSDDGTYKAGTGGGGSALWASSSGNLFPSPAVDVVSITSQSADAATNVALVVDTSTPWTLGQPVVDIKTGGFSVARFGMNFATNTLADYSPIVSIGYPVMSDGIATNDNAELFNIGFFSGYQQSLSNAVAIYNIGDSAGRQQVLTNVYFVFNLGDTDGFLQTVVDSNDIFNLGDGGGFNQTLTNSRHIFNYGNYAGENQNLSGSSDVYNYGYSAGKNMAGTFEDVMNFGYLSVPSQSHQITMGVASVASGDIFRLRNNGVTNEFTVGHSGNGFFAGTVSIGSLTNTLRGDGTDLIYTNASTVSGFQVDSGGGGARLQGGSAAQLKATGAANAVDLHDGSTAVRWFNGEFFPITSGKNLGSSSSMPWQDLALSRNITWNGNTNSLFDTWGAGTPEGVTTARPGSIYRDTLNGAVYKKSTGVGDTGWVELAAAGGTGDVVGPASSTDNAIVRYDGTTGKLVQNSAVTISDTGDFVSSAGTKTWTGLSTLAIDGTFHVGGTTTANSEVLLLNSGIRLGAAASLQWNPNAGVDAASDLFLYRDASNTLAQRNSTTTQTHRLYRTFTDASNYARMAHSFAASGRAVFAAETAGTGEDDINIELTPAGTGGVVVGIGGTAVKSILSATATLDFGNILAAASADLTVTVTGCAVGDSVDLGLPAAPDASIVYNGFVSAANTVTVRAFNVGAIGVDPASATYRTTVHHF